MFNLMTARKRQSLPDFQASLNLIISLGSRSEYCRIISRQTPTWVPFLPLLSTRFSMISVLNLWSINSLWVSSGFWSHDKWTYHQMAFGQIRLDFFQKWSSLLSSHLDEMIFGMTIKERWRQKPSFVASLRENHCLDDKYEYNLMPKSTSNK